MSSAASTPTLHLVIPFAFASACHEYWQAQAPHLPNLGQLLHALSHRQWERGDELSLTLPHERLLCKSLGLSANSQAAPLAAWYASEQMLAQASQPHWHALAQAGAHRAAWAFITPAYMQVTTDRIVLHDPALLQLQEDEARQLFQTLKDWCAQDDVHLVWDTPNRWLAHSPHLQGLTCASLERVVHRDARQWLPSIAQAPVLQRLQTEAQMLLYNLPLNDARLQRGLPPVNTFWVSGCGSLAAPERLQNPAIQAVQTESSLAPLALSANWPQWLQQWQAIDQTLLADLLQRHRQGQHIQLTLGGEKNAVTLSRDATPAQPPGLLQRIASLLRGQPQKADAAQFLPLL